MEYKKYKKMLKIGIFENLEGVDRVLVRRASGAFFTIG